MSFRRITVLGLSLAVLLGVSLTAMAASNALNLNGGEDIQITCDGKRLRTARENATIITASCEPSAVAQSVVSIILVNADTNDDLRVLENGTEIDLATLPTENLSVRAETRPSTVGSVKFELDGNRNFRIENIAPYALFGDDNGRFNPWNLAEGAHTVAAVPYSDTNAGGTAGQKLTISFTLVNQGDDSGNTPPTPAPTSPATTPKPTTAPTSVPPTANVPLCPDHNPTQWHPLYDAARNCHYDHIHNSDPNDPVAVQLFGVPGAAWGQEISYPWETWGNASTQIKASETSNGGKARLTDVQFDGSPRENEAKHRGYKYNVQFEFNDVMPQIKNFGYLNPTGYIHGWRMQYHVVAGDVGAKTRFHSFFAELYSCSEAVTDPTPAKCGTIKAGGWGDFGILHVPYKQGHFPLPTDPAGQDHFVEPYRSGETAGVAGEIIYGRNLVSTWATDHHRQWGWNNHISYVFRIHDEPGYFDGSTFVNICRENDDTYSCGYNGTRHSFETFVTYVDDRFDADNDGYADFSGYTDRQGNINSTCTAIGVDCIPYELNHAPVGWNVYQQKENITPDHVKDFDLCSIDGSIVECPVTANDNVYDKGVFESIGWIKYPN